MATTTKTADEAKAIAHYNRGWNDARAEFDGARGEAADLADALFEERLSNLDIWGHLSSIPPASYRRGWKDAVWAIGNDLHVARR